MSVGLDRGSRIVRFVEMGLRPLKRSRAAMSARRCSAFLDRLAVLSSGAAPDYGGLRRLYEADPRLRVPATITSHAADGPRVVDPPLV